VKCARNKVFLHSGKRPFAYPALPGTGGGHSRGGGHLLLCGLLVVAEWRDGQAEHVRGCSPCRPCMSPPPHSLAVPCPVCCVCICVCACEWGGGRVLFVLFVVARVQWVVCSPACACSYIGTLRVLLRLRTAGATAVMPPDLADVALGHLRFLAKSLVRQDCVFIFATSCYSCNHFTRSWLSCCCCISWRRMQSWGLS
jgi:hypothetical protein